MASPSRTDNNKAALPHHKPDEPKSAKRRLRKYFSPKNHEVVFWGDKRLKFHPLDIDLIIETTRGFRDKIILPQSTLNMRRQRLAWKIRDYTKSEIKGNPQLISWFAYATGLVSLADPMAPVVREEE